MAASGSDRFRGRATMATGSFCVEREPAEMGRLAKLTCVVDRCVKGNSNPRQEKVGVRAGSLDDIVVNTSSERLLTRLGLPSKVIK